MNDAPERFANEDEVLAEIVRDDRRAPRRAGVVARVRETGEPLEEDLELEEDFFFAFDRQSLQPRFARGRLFATQTARVAEEIVVSVALFRRQRHRERAQRTGRHATDATALR